MDGDRGDGGRVSGHAGDLVVAALLPWGVTEIFTLSGGHVFPVYDACVREDVRIVDVRHEQTATFAAEATGKLTRRPGVAVLTAGPGVTNGISAITTAYFNGSPLVVLAGRAPQGRWGSGSLQEIDHLPLVESVTTYASTVTAVGDVGPVVSAAVAAAATPRRGPAFVDIPIDVMFSNGESGVPSAPAVARGAEPDPAALEAAAELLASAQRPVLVAGGDVWLGGAEGRLVDLVETLEIPTFLNGQGRGCLPASHRLCFSRERSALAEADVVAVVGSPLDFRLSFGRFGSARVLHVVDHVSKVAAHASVDVTVTGDLPTAVLSLTDMIARRPGGASARSERSGWVSSLRDRERARRAAEQPLLESGARPVHPMRIFGELASRLDPDAIVVGDGGDFVSFAGKLVASSTPGCWLDPGPYGCLGTGMGYVAAARLAHPDRQVVGLLGDGAFGFSAMDVDTVVRHDLPAVMVVGNNGIWGLEKHPMRALYGYDVAADLQPACRYDAVVAALGGAGETVSEPEDVGPALDRGFSSGVPYLVNVVTDPDVVYPRSSNLA